MDRAATRGQLVALVSFALFAAAALSAPSAHAKIVKATMFSPANGRNVDYRVYTPPGYSPKAATRYPLVVSLHGEGSTATQRAANFAPTLDAKILSGQIMPMIWVFPDGQTNSFYGNAFDGHKQVYSNIVKELIPLIDSTYKTVGNRENRALEGFSMGGFGAGLYAATDSSVFSAALLSAPAVPDWANLVKKQPAIALEMYNNVEANWRPYSVWDQTAANAPAIAAAVDYKLIVGDADSQLKGDLVFRDFLVSKGIDPKFQLLSGVNHTQSLYLQEGSGLAFLNQHFARVQAPASAMRAIPEPSACVLAALGALPFLRRRRSACAGLSQ